MSQKFDELIQANHPTGVVVAANRFFAQVEGLEAVGLNNQLLFENGDRGLVWEVGEQVVTVLNLDSEQVRVGQKLVLESDTFCAPVGEHLLGRVVSTAGQALDGGEPLYLHGREPVFKVARPIIERRASDEQLVTGVTVVDTIFPIVLGQRVAVIGDARTGKTSFLTQLASPQAAHRVYLYVMIGKRREDVQSLVRRLRRSGVMEHSVVLVADIFESLAQTYLAPYIGCAMAEWLREQGNDVVIIYDDLSNHAKVYRQIALQARASSGRDAYPADVFYSHSSLLERAGCFADSPHSITALPVVLSSDDDITGYLATNIMSITDGQLIFTRQDFQNGQRPAVSTTLSVSRIGGRARGARAQELVQVVLAKLADYQQTLEFSHFEAGQSSASATNLELGRRLFTMFRQEINQTYSLTQQQLMLEAALRLPADQILDVEALRKLVVGKTVAANQYDDFLKKILQTDSLLTPASATADEEEAQT